jgi:hypothetical protein
MLDNGQCTHINTGAWSEIVVLDEESNVCCSLQMVLVGQAHSSPGAHVDQIAQWELGLAYLLSILCCQC